MADVAAAANAIATAIRGIAPPPQGAALQSVSLTPFTGAVTEDFRVCFEIERIRGNLLRTCI